MDEEEKQSWWNLLPGWLRYSPNPYLRQYNLDKNAKDRSAKAKEWRRKRRKKNE